MAQFAVERKVFGLKKEATRGTAEATANVWIPVSRDSEFEVRITHLPDEQIRGIKTAFDSVQGIKDYVGIIRFDIESMNIGEILHSLFGSVSSVQQDLTTAYKHTFTPSLDTQYPSYTWFVDRKQSIKAYPLGCVIRLVFTGTPDGKQTAEAEIWAKTEATGAIGTPTWATPAPFTFHQVRIYIPQDAASPIGYARNWSLNITNGSILYRPYNQTQEISNILAVNKWTIDGALEMFFEDETERNKYLSHSANSIRISLIGANISGAFFHKLDLILYSIKYTAFPFTDIDGLIGAGSTFTGHYSVATAKQIQVELTNTKTSY